MLKPVGKTVLPCLEVNLCLCQETRPLGGSVGHMRVQGDRSESGDHHCREASFTGLPLRSRLVLWLGGEDQETGDLQTSLGTGMSSTANQQKKRAPKLGLAV